MRPLRRDYVGKDLAMDENKFRLPGVQESPGASRPGGPHMPGVEVLPGSQSPALRGFAGFDSRPARFTPKGLEKKGGPK